MINVNIYNIVGVVICVIGCGLILHYLFKEYEFLEDEFDED